MGRGGAAVERGAAMNALLVAIGGGLGAVARYLLSTWIQGRVGPGFPWGTFAINVSGSFLIGVILGLVERGALSSQARLFLAVGLLGGYTTFSSFSYENVQIVDTGDLGSLLLNAGGQVLLGLAAAYLGVIVARLLAQHP